jgi:hypothetical protein
MFTLTAEETRRELYEKTNALLVQRLRVALRVATQRADAKLLREETDAQQGS